MKKQRDIMINFPLPILTKSFTKSGRINLRPMLLEAMRTHIGYYCVKKKIRPDSTVLIIPGIQDDLLSRIVAATCFNHHWEDSLEFSLGWDLIEFAVKDFVKSHNRYVRTTNPPYCSISLSVWLDFVENEDYKDDFEKVALLAAMAVRSIIGPHTAKPIKWEFILSRMAGEPSKTEISALPEIIQTYDQTKHRKLKEKLMRELQKSWGIQYQFAGRKPWYCSDPKVNLSDWVISNQSKRVSQINNNKTAIANVIEKYPEECIPMYVEVERYFFNLIFNPKEPEISLDSRASELAQDFVYKFMKGQKWDDWEKTAIFWLKSKGTPI